MISAGIKLGKVDNEVAKASVEVMLTAGRFAAEVMQEFDVRSATDVTGFALIGHAWEMARSSGVTLQIDSDRVPTIAGALEMAERGILTGGDKTNREYVGGDVEIAQSVSKEMRSLLFDPQTAGGMLITTSSDGVEDLLARLRQNYPQAEIIGRVLQRGKHSLLIK